MLPLDCVYHKQAFAHLLSFELYLHEFCHIIYLLYLLYILKDGSYPEESGAEGKGALVGHSRQSRWPPYVLLGHCQSVSGSGARSTAPEVSQVSLERAFCKLLCSSGFVPWLLMITKIF